MPDVTWIKEYTKYKQQGAQPFDWGGLIFLDPPTPSPTRKTDKHTLVYSKGPKESLHKADPKLEARIICGTRKCDHFTVQISAWVGNAELASKCMMAPLLHTCLPLSITWFNKWSHVFKLVTFSNPHISLNSKPGQRPFYYRVVRLQSMGWDYHI